MEKGITYKNLSNYGITTYYRDGSKTITYMNPINGGYIAYHSDGSQSITYKNLFDNGYTTYHPDGSRSITYKNMINGGFTTYHPDGSRSVTYKNLIDDGYTTYYIQDDDFNFGILDDKYCSSSREWLSSAIEQISNDLLAADDALSKLLKSIENECSRMTVAINETKAAFGNQEAGKQLITKLYQSIRNLMDTEGMLFIVKKNVRNYVQKVRE